MTTKRKVLLGLGVPIAWAMIAVNARRHAGLNPKAVYKALDGTSRTRQPRRNEEEAAQDDAQLSFADIL